MSDRPRERWLRAEIDQHGFICIYEAISSTVLFSGDAHNLELSDYEVMNCEFKELIKALKKAKECIE